jgi:hypothetical protein
VDTKFFTPYISLFEMPSLKSAIMELDSDITGLKVIEFLEDFYIY